MRMEIYHSQVQLSVEYLNALYIETIHIYVVSIRRSNLRKKTDCHQFELNYLGLIRNVLQYSSVMYYGVKPKCNPGLIIHV